MFTHTCLGLSFSFTTEIRNPLAAGRSLANILQAAFCSLTQNSPTILSLLLAISACSFVASAVNEGSPLQDDSSRVTVREDVNIISSSLQFTNDLLRSMIDMQKAASNRIQLDLKPTSVLHDVLEPVATMLHTRGCSFEVQYECEPRNMVILTDRIRLKQIILNL